MKELKQLTLLWLVIAAVLAVVGYVLSGASL